MNRMTIALCIVLAGGALPDAGRAESPPPGDAPGLRVEQRGGPGRHGSRRGMRRHHPFLQEWMQTLREENPEEYQRLARLMEEDPRAFHDALRARLTRERLDRAVRDDPELRRILQTLAPADRALLREKVSAMLAPRGPGPGPAPESPTREPLPSEESLQPLKETYREAESEAARENIRQAVRDALSERFEIREARYRARIESLQEEIRKLEAALQQRAEWKDAIIERRLQRFLETP